MLACLVPSPGPSANTLAARPTAAHDFFRRRSASKRTLRRLTGRLSSQNLARYDEITLKSSVFLLWSSSTDAPGNGTLPPGIRTPRIISLYAVSVAQWRPPQREKKLRFAEIISRVYLRVMTCSWVFSTSRNTVVLHGINGFVRCYHTKKSIFWYFGLPVHPL